MITMYDERSPRRCKREDVIIESEFSCFMSHHGDKNVMMADDRTLVTRRRDALTRIASLWIE
jgi:hypothetical protein